MISLGGSQCLETFLVTTPGEKVPPASDEEEAERLPHILQEETTCAPNGLRLKKSVFQSCLCEKLNELCFEDWHRDLEISLHGKAHILSRTAVHTLTYEPTRLFHKGV